MSGGLFYKDGKARRATRLLGTKLELAVTTPTVVRWVGELRMGRFHHDYEKTRTRVMVEYFPDQWLWRVRVGSGVASGALVGLAAEQALDKELYDLKVLVQETKKSLRTNTKTLEFLKKLKP